MTSSIWHPSGGQGDFAQAVFILHAPAKSYHEIVWNTLCFWSPKPLTLSAQPSAHLVFAWFVTPRDSFQDPCVFIPLHFVSFPPRYQPWFLARHSVRSSTSTVQWWLSASVPRRGAGEVGFKRWSVPSLSPDPLSLIASRMNLLDEFPFVLFCSVLSICWLTQWSCYLTTVSIYFVRKTLSTGVLRLFLTNPVHFMWMKEL